MARKPREESSSKVYHFINRGVNKKTIFHAPKDHGFYLDLIRQYKDRLGIEIYHYCVMTNHSHLILMAPDRAALSKFAYFIQRRYAYYYCDSYAWEEQVFRRSFVSIPIPDDAYLLECARYIERNPVKAQIVNCPSEYFSSSYSYYAEGKKNDLLTPSPSYLGLSENIAERRTAYRLYVGQERRALDKLTMYF
jgi:putative transposase